MNSRETHSVLRSFKKALGAQRILGRHGGLLDDAVSYAEKEL